MPEKKGLVQRLTEGVVIGDGGFVFCLEKRGYLKAGPWTPEVSVEHPEALRELHREFLRAGSDVMQTFTFYGSEDKLANRGNDLGYSCEEINDAACRIAKEVAAEGDALVAGGLSQTPSYLNGDGESEVQKMFQGQIDSFLKHNLDFLIVEYFEHVEEIEWALEVCRKTNLPIVASMAIGPEGDLHGVSAGDCAVRMAKAGAVAVGINCHFDPFVSLQGLKKMKQGLQDAGLDNVYLVSQPLGFLTPEVNKQGFTILPEFPFALEPRICTRFEIQKYAREAYNLGVRYIGGCCGFESYHIRAVSEELKEERGNKIVPASLKHQMWGEALKMHTKPWVRARAGRDYWEKINPTTGRPHSAGLRTVVDWKVAPGDKELKQMKTKTTQQEIEQLRILQTQKEELSKEKAL